MICLNWSQSTTLDQWSCCLWSLDAASQVECCGLLNVAAAADASESCKTIGVLSTSTIHCAAQKCLKCTDCEHRSNLVTAPVLLVLPLPQRGGIYTSVWVSVSETQKLTVQAYGPQIIHNRQGFLLASSCLVNKAVTQCRRYKEMYSQRRYVVDLLPD